MDKTITIELNYVEILVLGKILKAVVESSNTPPLMLTVMRGMADKVLVAVEKDMPKAKE